MDQRLLEYYNRELLHLREVGGEFARQFPKIAGRLGLEGFECADPYVERMLEGLHSVLWNEQEQRFARMAVPGPHAYTLDMTVDSSLFGLVEFGALAPNDPHAVSTLKQVEDGFEVE